MVAKVNLDMDALRSLTVAMDTGSFARAAERLGRTPSALSLQMRKLEGQAGRPLLRKSGRGVELTEAGETLLRYARRMLALNDEATALLSEPEPAGEVRIGMPQDYAETRLPGLLGRFAQAHPGAQVTATVDRSAVLPAQVGRGELDLALFHQSVGDRPLAPEAPVDRRRLRRLAVRWLAAPGWVPDPTRPLPLALLNPPCPFRDMALEALEQAQIPWRPAFSSGGPAGVWAAVAAGLGVTARPAEAAPPGLLDISAQSPPLPDIELWLATPRGAKPAAAAARLHDLVLEALAEAS